MRTADVVIVGGGMVGAAIGYGLARHGVDTAIVDEGDRAFRAARGNFGLVWVQTKGWGMQRYAEWTRESSELYGDFAAELREETGVDIGHSRPGGLIVCLGDREMEERAWLNAQMRQQCGEIGYEAEMIDRKQVEALLPGVRLGPDVSGGSWSPYDGHVGSLFLLRAMHAGFARAGGRYFPECRVESVSHAGGRFTLRTAGGDFRSAKIVLAAGHGIPRLAATLGLHVPTTPERGQIMVTERVRPILPLPLHTIRQTAEGSLMIGDTKEDVGFDDGTTLDGSVALAARAVRQFPDLANLRMVRTWGALRVLPPDKFPIYDESETCPGAFVATMHSGVTLAAVHARRMAAWIADGVAPPDFDRFSARRFDVQAA